MEINNQGWYVKRYMAEGPHDRGICLRAKRRRGVDYSCLTTIKNAVPVAPLINARGGRGVDTLQMCYEVHDPTPQARGLSVKPTDRNVLSIQGLSQ